MARFTRFSDREAVMRNVRKLKGSRIFVNEDLCPASHNIRKAQFTALKEARSQGKIAYFRHTKLIIKEKHASNQVTATFRRDRSVEHHRDGTPSGTSDGGGEGAQEPAGVSAASMGGQSSAIAPPAPGVGSAAAIDGAGCPPVDVDVSSCATPTPSSRNDKKSTQSQRITRQRK
ncbi:hypothetical protein Pcinc_006322 [Petrolisthes cinctipes]|uniref:Uncharacterized protein n=1 Tax=Petrolisthes cinctipes TaxID=88211 RepID=A0AAE1GHP9_PETCI|nr:hypothetical protein Pcinc_006322 [Petrolisthes cinctipes]